MSDLKTTQRPAATAYKGGQVIPVAQDLETTPVTRKMTGEGLRGALVGWMSNGYVSRAVASNNLTVAIKTKNAVDPSANDIVSVGIGSTGAQRQITGALSVTVNAGAASGAGTFNLGATSFATIEQELFVYLGWRASTSTVFILLSRIPHARTYADFSATAANEKYGAYSGAAPASTDEVENIGRFNVTNSGTASYNWSVPAASVVISRPIFETSWLVWAPVYSASGSLTYTSVTSTIARYKIRIAKLDYVLKSTGTLGGSASTDLRATVPFECSQSANAPAGGYGQTATVAAKLFIAPATPDLITVQKYDGSNYATSGTNVINAAGFYEI